MCLPNPSSFLLSLLLLAAAAAAQEPNRVLLPITNDIPTKQYYTTLHIGTPGTRFPFNLVLDMGSSFAFTFCGHQFNTSSTTFRRVPCRSPTCNSIPRPSCSPSGCIASQFNPFSDRILRGQLSVDAVSFRATDGSKTLGRISARRFPFMCVEQRDFGNVTMAAKGAVGLSRSKLSFPFQVASGLGTPLKFAFCLPITRTRSRQRTSTGAFFIGGGPYRASPYPHDLSTLFIVTPLLTNPTTATASNDFYIWLKSITVDSKPLRFDEKLLSFHNGVGGTKLSTLVPYTTLHHKIYRALTKQFLKRAKAMGMKRTDPVAPFRFCFNSTTVERTITGPRVPVIGLGMPGKCGDQEWEIYGANSMEELPGAVMCLALMDGGKNPAASITIGTYQMENHLLEFDLSKEQVGISRSLLLMNTNCTSFGVEVEF